MILIFKEITYFDLFRQHYILIFRYFCSRNLSLIEIRTFWIETHNLK